jgi:hypothetical protein
LLSTAIDNIFIDTFKNTEFTVKQLPNGLSDHDGKMLTPHNISIRSSKTQRYLQRSINESSILEFKLHLSNKSWKDIFTDENVDVNFNKFLNTYLRIFYQRFTFKKVYHKCIHKVGFQLVLKYHASTKEIYTCFAEILINLC